MRIAVSRTIVYREAFGDGANPKCWWGPGPRELDYATAKVSNFIFLSKLKKGETGPFVKFSPMKKGAKRFFNKINNIFNSYIKCSSIIDTFHKPRPLWT